MARSTWRNLGTVDAADYLDQVAKGTAGVDPAAQTLARSSGNWRAQRVGQRMVDDQLDQNQRNAEDQAREAERQAKEAERLRIREEKRQAAMAKAEAARAIREATARGIETKTDIETGEKTIETNADGTPKYKVGPIDGAPLVPVTTGDRPNPMIPGDDALGATGGTSQTTLQQPIRDDHGRESLAPAATSTDTRGIQTKTFTDPVTGQPGKKAVGVDAAKYGEAEQKAAEDMAKDEIRMRVATADLKLNQLKQRALVEEQPYDNAKKRFDEVAKEKNTLEAKPFRRNGEGQWEKYDPNTGRAAPFTDPDELNTWLSQRKDLNEQYLNAKKRHDELFPGIKDLHSQQEAAKLEKAQALEAHYRRVTGLPDEDGGAAAIMAAAEAGELNPEQEAAASYPLVYSAEVLDAAEARDAAEQSGQPIEKPAEQPLIPKDDPAKLEVFRGAFKGLKDADKLTVGGSGDTFTMIRGPQGNLGSIDTDKNGLPVITVGYDAQGDLRRAVDFTATKGTPIYLKDSDGKRDTVAESQYVASVFQAGQASPDDEMFRNRMRMLQATPDDIAKKVRDGKLSVQAGESLLKGIYKVSMAVPDPSTPQAFGQWISKADADTKRKWNTAKNQFEKNEVKAQFLREWADENAWKPGMDETLLAKMQAKVIPIPEKDFFDAADTVSGIVDAITGLKTTSTAFQQLKVGLKRPDHYTPAEERSFAQAEAFQREMERKTAINQAEGASSSVGESFREAGSSLPFSLVTLASYVTAKYTVGQFVTGPATAKVGGAIGSRGGPKGAGIGAAAGQKIGMEAAGMAGSAYAAYRMAGQSFLRDTWKDFEAEAMRTKGRPMNEAEKKEAYAILLPIAQDTGLWEAGPEAVGNAVTLGAGKFIFGSSTVKKFSKDAMKKLALKMGAALGATGVEVAGETATAIQQKAGQAKAQAILEGADPDKINADWSAKGIKKALGEVGPQTLATMAIMGGTAGGVKLVGKGIDKAREAFQGPSSAPGMAGTTAPGGPPPPPPGPGTPPPSGAGPTPGPTPTAGATGTAPGSGARPGPTAGPSAGPRPGPSTGRPTPPPPKPGPATSKARGAKPPTRFSNEQAFQSFMDNAAKANDAESAMEAWKVANGTGNKKWIRQWQKRVMSGTDEAAKDFFTSTLRGHNNEQHDAFMAERQAARATAAANPATGGSSENTPPTGPGVDPGQPGRSGVSGVDPGTPAGRGNAGEPTGREGRLTPEEIPGALTPEQIEVVDATDPAKVAAMPPADYDLWMAENIIMDGSAPVEGIDHLPVIATALSAARERGDEATASILESRLGISEKPVDLASPDARRFNESLTKIKARFGITAAQPPAQGPQQPASGQQPPTQTPTPNEQNPQGTPGQETPAQNPQSPPAEAGSPGQPIRDGTGQAGAVPSNGAGAAEASEVARQKAIEAGNVPSFITKNPANWSLWEGEANLARASKPAELQVQIGDTPINKMKAAFTPEMAVFQMARSQEAAKSMNARLMTGKDRGASQKELIQSWVNGEQMRLFIEKSRAENPAMWQAYDQRQAEVANLKEGDSVRLPYGSPDHPTGVPGKILKKFAKNWRIDAGDGRVMLLPPHSLRPLEATAATGQSNPQVAGKSKELVARMDAALARMRERGDESHPSYAKLQAKRDAVASGKPYDIKDVSKDIIGDAGAGIGKLTKETGLKPGEAVPAKPTPAASIAKTVQSAVEKAVPRLKGKIVLKDTKRATGGAWMALDGTLTISPKDIAREIKVNGWDEATAVQVLTDLAVTHEVAHFAQVETLRKQWQAEGGKGDFEAYFMDYNAGQYAEMGGKGSGIDQAAAAIYDPTPGSPQWQALSPGQKGAEIFRMALNAKMKGETNELVREMARKGWTDGFKNMIRAAIDYLKSILKDLPASAKKHLDELEAFYREITGAQKSKSPESTGKSAEVSAPMARTGEKVSYTHLGSKDTGTITDAAPDAKGRLQVKSDTLGTLIRKLPEDLSPASTAATPTKPTEASAPGAGETPSKKPKMIDTPARREAFRLLRSGDLPTIDKIIGGKVQAPPTGMLKIIKGRMKEGKATQAQREMWDKWEKAGFNAYLPKSAFGTDANGKVAQELHGMLFSTDKQATDLDDWAGLLGDKVTNDEAMLAVMAELEQVAKGKIAKKEDLRNPNRELSKEEEQAIDFKQANDFDFGRDEVIAGDLTVGQKVTIDGEEFTVKAVADGKVTLQDGSRFGKQVLDSGESVWVEEPDADIPVVKTLVDEAKERGYSSVDAFESADPDAYAKAAARLGLEPRPDPAPSRAGEVPQAGEGATGSGEGQGQAVGQPVTAKEITDAINQREREALFIKKGRYHAPGLRPSDQESAGRVAYEVEIGREPLSEWTKWMEQNRRENRFSDKDAPVIDPKPAKAAPVSKMDVRNADSKELFADDGGFKLGQETTKDGDKIAAERKAKEDAKAAMDAAQGDMFAPELTDSQKAIQDIAGDLFASKSRDTGTGDLFGDNQKPSAEIKAIKIEGTKNAFNAYKILTAKRAAGKALTPAEEQTLLEAESALGQKMAFDMAAENLAGKDKPLVEQAIKEAVNPTPTAGRKTIQQSLFMGEEGRGGQGSLFSSPSAPGMPIPPPRTAFERTAKRLDALGRTKRTVREEDAFDKFFAEELAKDEAYDRKLAEWVDSIPQNKPISFIRESGDGLPSYYTVTKNTTDPARPWRTTYFHTLKRPDWTAEEEIEYEDLFKKTRWYSNSPEYKQWQERLYELGSRPTTTNQTRIVPSGHDESKTRMEAVKHAMSMAGNRDPEIGSLFSSASREAAPFYSQLSRTLEEKMPKSAPIAQVMQIAQSGAKAEEIKWSGLLPWLQSAAVDGKVSKDAVLSYLADEGAVRFEEVTTESKTTDREAAYNAMREHFARRIGYLEPETEQLLDDWLAGNATNSDIEDATTLNPEDFGAQNDPGQNTRYAQYTLPGGENYREVVLAMPVKGEIKTADEIIAEISDLGFAVSEDNGFWSIEDAEGEVVEFENTPPAVQKLLTEMQAMGVAGEDQIRKNQLVPIAEYRSSHFPDVPNYVAHMRLNERTDASGAPGLFIEELQSDRHQAARKQGYNIPPSISKFKVSEFEGVNASFGRFAGDWNVTIPTTVPNVRRELGFTIKEGRRHIAKLLLGPGRTHEIGSFKTDTEARDAILNSEVYAHNATAADVGDYVALYTSESDAAKGSEKSGIPDAPFRTTWPLALFKRALRDAVASGKEWIGWTPGDVQADRFDLSKQVDEVQWDNIDGYGKKIAISFKKKGETRLTDGGIHDAEKLPDVVGKELAEKIIAKAQGQDTNERGSFSGLDLKVGGSGMNGFYDNMLPKEIGKYVKQWGGKVERDEVAYSANDDLQPILTYEQFRSREGFNPDENVRGFYAKYLARREKRTPIWKVSITPAMRAGVSQGQALFSSASPDPNEAYSKPIKPTGLPKLMPILMSVVEKGEVKTPEDMAKFLEPIGLQPISQAVWGILESMQGRVAERVDWAKLYAPKETPQTSPPQDVAIPANPPQAESGEMIPATSSELEKGKWKPNHTVFVAVSFPDYERLGVIQVPHDGTEKGMGASWAAAEREAQDQFGDVSHSGSYAGATDSTGRVTHVVSPNGKAEKLGTPEGEYARGNLNAFRDDALSKILKAKDDGDIETANALAQKEIDRVQKWKADRQKGLDQLRDEVVKANEHFKKGGKASDLDSRFDTNKRYLDHLASHQKFQLDNIASADAEIAKWESLMVRPAASGPKALTFEDFRKQYTEAFQAMNRYTPEEVGSGHYAEKMAALADQYPEWAEKVEAEAASPAAEWKGIEQFSGIWREAIDAGLPQAKLLDPPAGWKTTPRRVDVFTDHKTKEKVARFEHLFIHPEGRHAMLVEQDIANGVSKPIEANVMTRDNAMGMKGWNHAKNQFSGSIEEVAKEIQRRNDFINMKEGVTGWKPQSTEAPAAPEPANTDQPIIARLKREIERMKKYDGELTPDRVVRAINEAAWSLMGDSQSSLRQDAMEFLTGTRPPKAKAGVNLIADELKKWVAANREVAPTAPVEPAKQAPEPGRLLSSASKRQEPQKNLVAVHNLSIANLKNILRIGGIPVPSLAVIRADKSAFDNFGEITLVAKPDMVDPQVNRQSKIFNADVYSPRYPQITTILKPGDGKKLSDSFDKFRDETLAAIPAGASYSWNPNQIAESIKSDGFNGLQYNPLINYAFLRSKGEIKPPKKGVDDYAFRSEMTKKLSGRRDEMEAWFRDHLDNLGIVPDEKIFNGFTYSGNRRYLPHNLDTVVKLLKKGLKDGEGFNYGVPSIRAANAKPFRTLKAIQQSRDHIVTKEEMEALKEEVNAEFMKLSDEILPYRKHGGDGFRALDSLSDDFKAMAQGGGANWKHLREMYPDDNAREMVFKPMAEFLEKLRHMPSEYFEAKIQRAVALSEFEGAVVPEETPTNLIGELKRRGLSVVKYPTGDKAARAKAVASFAEESNALFSSASPSKWPTNLYAYTYRTEANRGSVQHIVNTFNERTGMKEDRVFDTYAEAKEEMDRLDDLGSPALLSSVSPEQDARYLELAKDPEGNKAELQRMVDEAAKAAGYVNLAYRGVDKQETNAQSHHYPDGVSFWAENKEYAQRYQKDGGATRSAFIRSNNPVVLGKGESLADKLPANFWRQISKEAKDQYANHFGKSWVHNRSLISDAQEHGFDAIKTDEAGGTWIILDPSQVKSADPVTYDKNGNVIPLSQRFNPESDSILFSSASRSELPDDSHPVWAKLPAVMREVFRDYAAGKPMPDIAKARDLSDRAVFNIVDQMQKRFAKEGVPDPTPPVSGTRPAASAPKPATATPEVKGAVPVGGAASRIPVSAKPVGDIRKGVSAPQVIKQMQGVLDSIGHSVPIRVGNLKGKKSLGEYFTREHLARIKTANDIPTAAHELGHALQKGLFGNARNAFTAAGVPAPAIAEMEAVGRALYGTTIPVGGYVSEGFAEWFSVMVYGGNTEGRAAAPKFHDWFKAEVEAKNPKLAKAVAKAQQASETWRNQGDQERARQSIYKRPGRIRELGQAIASMDVANDWLDTNAPIDRFVAEAVEKGGRPIEAKDNPALAATALRMTSTARAEFMVKSAMIDFAGNPVGKSLHDILSPVRGKRMDFLIYLWAKRAIALWNDPNGARNPGLSKQDAMGIIADLETPLFQRVASEVYKWNDQVLDYAAQASDDYKQVVGRIRAADPGFYIPLFREFEAFEQAGKGGTASAASGKLLDKLRGSGRRIKEPFSGMISQAADIVAKAHQKRVLDQIFKIADTVPDLGRLVAEIDPKKVPAAQRALGDLVDEINRKLRKAGIDEIDLTPEQEAIMQEMATFFSPSYDVKNGERPILPVFRNGKIRLYEMDPGLYETLSGMNAYRLPAIVDMTIGLTNRTFRMGTTGLRASFSLITNPQRDFSTLHYNSRASAHTPELFVTWMGELGKAFLYAITGGAIHPKTIETLERLGGKMATPLGQDMRPTERASRRLFETTGWKIVDIRNWADYARDLLQFPELASRATEMKLVGKDLGWKPGQPMDEATSLLLLQALKQVTTDFTAAGRFGRVANQVVPFFNAGIQGPRASVRALKRDWPKFLRRGVEHAIVALVAWWFAKDTEWWKEMSTKMKFGHTFIPFEHDGKKELIRIPRSFETDGLFMSGTVALADAWYQEDPKEATEWMGEWIKRMMPSIIPAVGNTAAEQLANKKFFWDMPIVPRSMEGMDTAEQVGPYTSAVASKLGQMTGISPLRIDHVINGTFGGAGTDLVQLFGTPEEIKREKELVDLPVLGTMFVRGGQSTAHSESVDKLYDAIDEVTKIQKSNRIDETPKQQQIRLMLTDAQKAITALGKVSQMEFATTARRELEEMKTKIASEAVENYRKGSAARNWSYMERVRAETMLKRKKAGLE